MMTLDDAFSAAAQLLDQRGQLLNAHLLKAVQGNKDHFRDVRARLIERGLAEDRSGVGLVRTEVELIPTESSLAGETEEITFATVESTRQFNPLEFETIENEWFLMSAGRVRGPVRLDSLREMIRLREIKSSDVVRKGADGLWQQPEQFTELKSAVNKSASKPTNEQRRDSVAGRSPLARDSSSSGAGGLKARSPIGQDSTSGVSNGADAGSAPSSFVPPEKTWNTADQTSPGILARAWQLSADHVGGGRRLALVLCLITAASLFVYWWRLLPSSAAIVTEFTTCRDSLSLLQQHRAPRSEYAPVVQKYRQRVAYLVSRLESRANEHYPIEQALYLAGSQGLLPWLDNPIDSFAAETEFDKQILRVRHLMSGTGAHQVKKH